MLTFSRLQSLSLGYEPRALFTARFELPWRVYNNRDKIDAFAKALLDKVGTIPGVQNAAISSNGPLMGGWQTGFWREENPRPQPSDMLNSDLEVVGGDYFPPLKVPLVRGRTFNDRDTKDSPRVIIIDQAMAEQYFPGEDPIGKRLGVDAGNDEEGWVMSEIVGVVAKMRFHAVDEMAPLPVVYCLLGQAQRTSLTLFIRSTMASASLERAIHDAATSVDPLATGVRCASDDRSRARNLGKPSPAHFSFLRLCWTRAYARDHRPLRASRLHDAQTRP